MEKRLQKGDVSFLAAIFLFGLIMAARVFDHRMEFHYVPMGLMQNYTFNQAALLGLFVIQTVFFGVCLLQCQDEQKKNVRYLLAFLSVFTFPMFASTAYWGSFDMYAFILLFPTIGLLLWGRMEWMSIPLCFIMICICPASLLGNVCLIVSVLIEKIQLTKKKKYAVCLIGCIIAALLGEAVVATYYHFYSDAQTAISGKKFLAILILCIPYYMAAFIYFKKKLESEGIKAAVALLGLPGVLIQLQANDYGKAVFYGFVYYIMLAVCSLVLGNGSSIAAMEETKGKVASAIAFPVLIIAYPLLFMLLWIAGPLPLFEEVFVGL